MKIKNTEKRIPMPETITKRVDGESYVSLYFDGSILPDETKALLNALAKEEIENNTFCDELPDGIIDKSKTLYYIDITLDKKTFITAIRLGAELVIADDYLLARGESADEYKQAIGKYRAEGNNNISLSALCGAFSTIEIEPETPDEERQIILWVVNK